jgi:hypothetical protein
MERAQYPRRSRKKRWHEYYGRLSDEQLANRESRQSCLGQDKRIPTIYYWRLLLRSCPQEYCRNWWGVGSKHRLSSRRAKSWQLSRSLRVSRRRRRRNLYVTSENFPEIDIRVWASTDLTLVGRYTVTHERDIMGPKLWEIRVALIAEASVWGTATYCCVYKSNKNKRSWDTWLEQWSHRTNDGSATGLGDQTELRLKYVG